MKQNQIHVKGMHIWHANSLMMILAGLLFVIIWCGIQQTSEKAQTLAYATDDFIFCQEMAVQVTEGSDYLTEQVRLYVVTGQPDYAENYINELYITQSREQALQELEERRPEEAENAQLQAALDKSNDLAQTELYAIGLMSQALGVELCADWQDVTISSADLALSDEEKIAQAQELVFDQAYEAAKEEIAACVDSFLSVVTQETYEATAQAAENLNRITQQQYIGLSLLFCISLLTFGIVITYMIRPLRRYIRDFQEDKTLEERGFYEFRYLARTYNHLYQTNAAHKQELRHEADHDGLTGIWNRGAFEKQRQRLRDSTEPMAFLLVDVDRFKDVNDTYGHETGDQVLKKVSQLLQAGFRSNDMVVRLGGDEFGVIMRKITPDSRSVIVEKIDAFNRILQQGEDHLPSASLTVGVTFSDHGFGDEMFQQADKALYHRKENGRCGCQFYEEDAS